MGTQCRDSVGFEQQGSPQLRNAEEDTQVRHEAGAVKKGERLSARGRDMGNVCGNRATGGHQISAQGEKYIPETGIEAGPEGPCRRDGSDQGVLMKRITTDYRAHDSKLWALHVNGDKLKNVRASLSIRYPRRKEFRSLMPDGTRLREEETRWLTRRFCTKNKAGSER